MTQSHHERSWKRRFAAGCLAVWFVLLAVAVPLQGRAVPIPQPVIILEDIPAQIRENVTRALKDSIGFQLQLALVNALNFFGERVAYETAVWIASGGKGQSALYNRESWDTFLADSAFGAGLQFVEDMDKYFGDQWGFEGGLGLAQFICAPSNPEIAAKIKIGLLSRLQPREPLCTWKQFSEGWDAYVQQDTVQFLSGVGVMFEPGESDLSSALELHVALGEKQAEIAFADSLQRLQDKGWKPVQDFVAGTTKTPASVVQDSLTRDLVQGQRQGAEINAESSAAALASIDTLVPMLQAAGQALAVNFAVTLAAEAVNRNLMGKGLFVGDLLQRGSGDPFGTNASTGGAAAARTVYADFIRPRVSVASNYDALSEFLSCDVQRRQPNTCVLDEGFAEAARRGVRVADAVRDGLLHADWALVPKSDAALNQDARCAREAYCASNLAKLRAARIIPVGWEMAANHPQNTPGNPVKLGQAIAAFNQPSSPYYGLIDPNWIIRYPGQQCNLRAPTAVLAERGTSVRAESCVDATSCLRYDADGRCVGGFGYCVREENIWHVQGQSCPASAATCRVYAGPTNATLAVLTSTVERGSCSVENAGCSWYATTSVGEDAWSATGGRRYFNRNVERCEPAHAGCTELIPAGSAGRNAVRNGSFEDPTDALVGWTVVQAASGAPGYDGAKSIQRAGQGANAVQTVRVLDGAHTLSASVFRAAGATGVPVIQLEQPPGRVICGMVSRDIPEDAWTRMSASCALTTGTYTLRVALGGGTGTVLVDAVQLEPGEGSTPYRADYADNAAKRYLTIAPSEYRCADFNPDGTLNTANDDSRCVQYAAACSAGDIGCTRFTPTDGSGAFAGKYTDADQCPVACVGYAAFREAPSRFDARNAFDYFIPSTARQCTAAEAGCSEFTNLDALAAGGEAREYFTALRFCRKPADAANARTYYTWEGSQERGFQLVTFLLEAESAGERAPRTLGSGDCQAAYGKRTTDPAYDPEVTPDCRAFTSQGGVVYYRRLSRTVAVTDTCTPYRISHLVPRATCVDANGGTHVPADPAAPNGLGTCTISGNPRESARCSAGAVSCRAYRGNAGGALRTVYAADFDDANAPLGWSNGTRSSESIIVGGQSLRVSRLTTTTMAATQNGASVPLLRSGATYELIVVAKGTGVLTAGLRTSAAAGVAYAEFAPTRATFGTTWQRIVFGPTSIPEATAVSADDVLALDIADGVLDVDQLVLREIPQSVTVIRGSWTTPAACDRASIAENAPPQPQGMLGCRAYRDQGNRTVTLRSFARLCSDAAVGCTAFYATQNSASPDAQEFATEAGGSAADDVRVPADAFVSYVDDGTKSCPVTARGCRAMGVPTLDRARDATGNTVTGWSTTYLKDDPDRYTGQGATLCRAQDLFCQEYRGQDGALAYFKDPLNRTCTYRDRVAYRGSTVRGWFRDGVEPPEPCDPSFALGGGTQYGIRKNADTDVSGTSANEGYQGWVGTCEPAYDQCAELLDPSDRSYTYPEGQPYYAIRSSLDLAACSGGVSQKEGCVLLNDTERPNVLWSSRVSYAASAQGSDQRVAPADCTRDPAACRRCVVPRVCRNAAGAAQSGGPSTCFADSDCNRSTGFRCTGGAVYGACTTDAACAANDPNAVCAPLTNDTNLLVRVRPDRACSQWYEKSACNVAFDAREGRTVQSCPVLDLRDANGRVVERPAPSYLTLAEYQQRDRSYTGEEYSGYSIPDTAALESLKQVTIGGVRTLMANYCPPGGNGCHPSAAGLCAANVGDNAECGPRIEGQRGQCQGGRCYYGATVAIQQLPTGRAAKLEPSCKAYPERDAPFPLDEQEGILRTATERNPGFEQANVCNDADGLACECSYRKVQYGGRTEYLGLDGNVDNAVCVGGTFNGQFCDLAAPVGQRDVNNVKTCQLGPEPSAADGVCTALDRSDFVAGVEGFCLERDASMPIYGSMKPDLRACTQFLPVDRIQGSIDLNNYVQTAGYAPTGDTGKFYCVEAKGNALPASQRSTSAGGYPSEATQYWVAARRESEYDCDRIPQTPDGIMQPLISYRKAMFSPARRSPVDGSSPKDYSFFRHAYQNPVVWNDERFGSYDDRDGMGYLRPFSFIDRRGAPGRLGNPPYSTATAAPIEESSFWQVDSNGIPRRRVHKSEVEKIVIRNFDDDYWGCGVDIGPNMSIELNESKRWMACVKNDHTVYYGGETARDASPCWGGQGGGGRTSDDVQRTMSDTEITDWVSGSHDFNEAARCAEEDDKFAGIQVMWDENGYLIGIQGGYCGERQSMSAADIYFVFREQCTEVRQVAGDAGAGSKAWTDRVAGALATYPVNPLGYTKATRETPFGSAKFNGNDLLAGSEVTKRWFVPPESSTPDLGPLDGSVVPAGAPYACKGTCVGPGLQGTSASLRTATELGVDRLQQVFGTMLAGWKWEENDRKWISLPHAVSDITDQHGSAPIVRGVGTCVGDLCAESVSNTFTVIGPRGPQESGDVVSEGGVLSATLQFFFNANTNQMPVRRVVVDWGNGADNYDSGGSGNSFANRRGLKPDSATETFCDESTFGQERRACVESPMVFQGVRYECNPGGAGLTPCSGGQPENAHMGCWDQTYGNSSGACIFVPRVHIKDNWGWCTGTCPGGPGGNGCYTWELQQDECNVNTRQGSNNPWVSFAGRIVVKPPQ